jgi:hypothetical protein
VILPGDFAVQQLMQPVIAELPEPLADEDFS